jgi:hypothetical protein
MTISPDVRVATRRIAADVALDFPGVRRDGRYKAADASVNAGFLPLSQ